MTVVGNVVTEPELSVTPRGHSWVRFRLASTPGTFEDGQWIDKATTYLTVTAWRRTADNVASSLQKGQPIVVQGKLSVRSYTTKDGRAGQEVQIEATALGHNLARGTSAFHKPSRYAPVHGESQVESWPTAPPPDDPYDEGIAEPGDVEPAGLAADYGRPSDDAERSAVDVA